MGGADASVYVAVFAYLAIVLALFGTLPPRRAVVASLLGGFMFLPMFDRRLALGIVHTKTQLVESTVLAAGVLFHYDLWRRLRPGIWDGPVALLCAVPFFAAVANGHGAYEGASAVFAATFTWGAAYLLGRVYFRDGAALRDLARGVVHGALVYLPFCWWEIRMSPQLHRLVYGFHQHSFLQHMRDSGFRPMVFMQHGLMVATFMATGTLVAYWLWRSQDHRPFLGIPVGWVVLLLGATTVLCKSLAALVFLCVGLAVLEASRRLRSPTLVLALVAVAPVYCGARALGWTAAPIVGAAYGLVAPDRAESLEFRVRNENMLVARAMERPWFGWGRWAGQRVRDEDGRDISVTDGLWILTLGATGAVGLAALGGTLLLPVVALLRAYPRRVCGDPRLAPAAALAIALALWVLDDVLNAMVTPVFPLAAGALVTLARARRRRPHLAPRPATAPGTLAIELRRG